MGTDLGGRPPALRVLVVADRLADVTGEVAERLRALVAGGDDVHLVVRAAAATAPEGLPAPTVLQTPPPPPLAQRAARRLGRNGADPGDRLLEALRQEDGIGPLLLEVDAVVAAGDLALGVVPGLVGQLAPAVPVLPLQELDDRLLVLQRHSAVEGARGALQDLGRVLGAPQPSHEDLTSGADALVAALQAVPGGGRGDGAPWDEAGWHTVLAVLDELGDAKAWSTALRLVRAVSEWGRPVGGELAAELDLVRAHAALTVEGGTEDDVVALAGRLVPGLDAAVADGDPERATRLLVRAIGVLFHRELHADVERTPLVEDPAAFLAPLRRTRLWALLSEPGAASPRLVDRRRGDRPSVVVLPGSYGRFAVPLVTALEDVADVTVVDTTARRASFGFGVSEQVLLPRVAQAMGLPWEPDWVRVEAMEAADVAFVDWADRGSLLSVMAAPADVRVVLRVHSMDALSPWVHLLDWSRVDALVLVSEHVRDVVVAQLGEALARTEVHVVPNVIELHRFDLPKHPGAERVLAVVGWGQRVKDPLWALEVLALLRRDDPAWRLLLLGHDLRQPDVATTVAYTSRFRARLAQPDVAGAVDFVPFTDDVPDVLRGAGYVISSSVRESAPVGLTEGAASGAVPVVRDWPVFASVTGARRRFPAHWVVETPEQAAARIRETQDVDAWRAASDATREEVRRLFGYDDVAGRMRSVVLGGAGSART